MTSLKKLGWVWTKQNTLEIKELNAISPSFVWVLIEEIQPHCSHLKIYLINETDHKDEFLQSKLEETYDINYLKSNLQKAIRRKQKDVALATARQMLHQDPNQLLRRLPIVATEDVKWSATTNQMVWLMCWYSKTRRLSSSFVTCIFAYVSRLCEVDHVFDYRSMDTFDGLRGKIDIFSNYELALWVRRCYGGMDGDMKLLMYTLVQKAWDDVNDVFDGNHHEIKVDYFDSSHMLPVAIDFHCSDILDTVMEKTKLPYKLLKTWVWNFRSGVNIRKPWTQHDNPPFTFKQMIPQLDALGTEYWNRSKRVILSSESHKRQRLISEYLAATSKVPKIICKNLNK
jgi:hypothetical protein